MLARRPCTQPSVLVVDEPFAHQDPEMCDSIIALLRLHASSAADACCVVACRRYESVLWGKPADVTLRESIDAASESAARENLAHSQDLRSSSTPSPL